jgi:hypothetical protein
MYPKTLFILLLLFVFQTDVFAQKDPVLLENSIELRFEAKESEYPSLNKSLVLNVYLENTTEDTIYLLTMSCYGLKRFFCFKMEHIMNDPGISCTFNMLDVETLLPKASIEFQTYLYFENEIPKETIDVGFELTKIPKKEAQEKDILFLLYEKIPLEKFVFWKKIEGYSFRINMPLLRT